VRTSWARKRISRTARPSRSRSSATLTIDDHTSKSGLKRYPLGREPVTLRDGTPLTDAHGAPLVRHLHGRRPLDRQAHRDVVPAAEHANAGEQLAVEYMTELYPATVDIVGSTPPSTGERGIRS